jgi:hypothetical protein
MPESFGVEADVSIDPYAAVSGLFAKLEGEGHSPDRIADVLLACGLNATRRRAGDDYAVHLLRRMIAVVEGRTKNQPPRWSQ